MHFLRAGHVDTRDAASGRQGNRAADQRDVGASVTGRSGDGQAHFAAGEIGDAAHRIDGLERRAGIA